MPKTKSFEERLKEQFTSFSVPPPQEAKHIEHLYADYVEVIALSSNGSFVTATDIIERLFDEGEISKDGDTEGGNEMVEGSFEGELTIPKEARGEVNELGSRSAKRKDNNEKWANFVFQILEQRSRLFQDTYPFEYQHNRLILKKELSFENKVYVILLIASNLDFFDKVKSELTSDFELISYFTLKAYLPNHGVVKNFGKRSDYTGSAVTKIRNLAKDLKVHVNESELVNISERNYQERGLDLIGWLPFSDDCPNFQTILGQCACGKGWPSKHHDTKRYSHYLKFYRLKAIHAMFVPYGLITVEGRFFRSDDIEDDTLVFERKRIVQFFKDETEFNKMSSKNIVETSIKFAEDIV